MSPSGKVQNPTQTVPGRILSLLNDLPEESQTVVEQFVRFLREQARQGQPVVVISEQEEHHPYHYPTVPLPPATLDGLVGIMPPVGGDALADTEALYDEV